MATLNSDFLGRIYFALFVNSMDLTSQSELRKCAISDDVGDKEILLQF